MPRTSIEKAISLSLVLVLVLGNTKEFFSDARGFTCDRRVRTGSDKGMRCSFPAFILMAGMVQTFFSKSNSDQRAPLTSPERAAVRIHNDRALAAMPSFV